MFRVTGTKITLHKGDTGAMVVNLTGHTFTSSDRAVFTIANRNGTTILMSEEYAISNGSFTVQFTNEVTDKWPAGSYKWEVRVFINPTRTDGEITGGDEVITPFDEPQDIVVSPVLYDA